MPVRLFLLLLLGALLGLVLLLMVVVVVLLVGGDCGGAAHADGGAERWDLEVGGRGIIRRVSWRAYRIDVWVGEACNLVLIGGLGASGRISNTSERGNSNGRSPEATLFFFPAFLVTPSSRPSHCTSRRRPRTAALAAAVSTAPALSPRYPPSSTARFPSHQRRSKPS